MGKFHGPYVLAMDLHRSDVFDYPTGERQLRILFSEVFDTIVHSGDIAIGNKLLEGIDYADEGLSIYALGVRNFCCRNGEK